MSLDNYKEYFDRNPDMYAMRNLNLMVFKDDRTARIFTVFFHKFGCLTSYLTNKLRLPTYDLHNLSAGLRKYGTNDRKRK